ncbi:hypothetical protein [Ruegeria atlantica]|uniref:Uncharacterized protein n=1 Tax=Ruegeria atlantica TaxID=81569 RepID=A0A0P1E8S9_9RHOB|nr:hypothetical protein [Ruegeria atlantica]CUH44494.1 hypothetical protein RUM4293_03396 [Ruegeria atlantica]
MNQHTDISVTELNLADVLDAIDRATDLSATRKRDLRSDVKAIARWLDRPASSINADATELRARLDNLHHVQIGVSEKRLRNAISNLNTAIELTFATPVARRRTPYRTPEWKARLAACEKDWERHRIAGLATYCSETGIKESDVNDTVIPAYRDHLARKSLRKDPDRAIKMTIQTWNRLIDQGVAPHLQRLTPSRSNLHWTTPLSDFPQEFQADVDCWLDRVSNVDILSEDGPPKALRPQTVENIRVAIRKSATVLVLTGTPIESITSLAVLVEMQHFRTILRFFLDRNEGTVPTWLYGLASKLVTIARYQVKLPEQELDALAAIKARMKVSQDGLTEKNKLRLGQFDEPRNVALLIQLPAFATARARGRVRASRWDALDVMYSLSVDILISVPMRRFNLAAIDIDRHIIWRGQGAGRYAQIMIPGDDTKNEVAI